MNSQLLGLFLTFAAFFIGLKIKERFTSPIVDPLLISAAIIALVMWQLNISYDEYMEGAGIISFLIVPATVALVVPFYKNLDVFLKYKKYVVVGSMVGSIVSMLAIIAIGKLFSIDREVLISLIPKSITTALAIPTSEQYGGMASITALAVVLTGSTGVIISERIFKILKIEEQIAKGAILGTGSHAIGTSKAISEIGETAGAIAGLCIILTGFFTMIFIPFIIKLI